MINVSESLSKMFLLLLESLYKPDVVNSQSVENLLMLMRLAHVYDVERTLKSCQKWAKSCVCFMSYLPYDVAVLDFKENFWSYMGRPRAHFAVVRCKLRSSHAKWDIIICYISLNASAVWQTSYWEACDRLGIRLKSPRHVINCTTKMLLITECL